MAAVGMVRAERDAMAAGDASLAVHFEGVESLRFATSERAIPEPRSRVASRI